MELAMKTNCKTAGFSLMEINMAIFVMAVGILGLVALYPLGLRESTQGQADIKQSMFADYFLNQAIALASRTNITWTDWQNNVKELSKDTPLPINLGKTRSDLPIYLTEKFLTQRIKIKDPNWTDPPEEDSQYRISWCSVPGTQGRIVGIMVQSSDLVKTVSSYTQYSNNPIYYAEVMFQGDPTR